jgi:hypothetical protein
MHAYTEIARWVIGICCVTIGCLITFANWMIVWNWFIRRKRSSRIPLVGGVLSMIGLMAIPIGSLSHWCWLPLVADVGCIPILVQLALFHLRRNFFRSNC